MFNPKKRFTEDCGGFTVNNEQGPVGPGAAALAGKTNDFLILNGSAPGGVGLPAALQSYILQQQQQQQSQQQSQEILFSSVQQLLSGLGAGGDSANNYNSLTALTHQQHTPQPSPVPSGQVSGAESSNTAGTKWSSSSSIVSNHKRSLRLGKFLERFCCLLDDVFMLFLTLLSLSIFDLPISVPHADLSVNNGSSAIID
jgi:hypothetical protein